MAFFSLYSRNGYFCVGVECIVCNGVVFVCGRIWGIIVVFDRNVESRENRRTGYVFFIARCGESAEGEDRQESDAGCFFHKVVVFVIEILSCCKVTIFPQKQLFWLENFMVILQTLRCGAGMPCRLRLMAQEGPQRFAGVFVAGRLLGRDGCSA